MFQGLTQLHSAPLPLWFCSTFQDTTADLGVYYPRTVCRAILTNSIAALKWKLPGSHFPGSHSAGGYLVDG